MKIYAFSAFNFRNNFRLLSMTSAAQQIDYSSWKEESKENIRLLPEYGHVPKTADQKEADEEFIQLSLKQDGTREKALQHGRPRFQLSLSCLWSVLSPTTDPNETSTSANFKMSQATYRILTDLTVILHLTFIIFVVLGGFLARGRLWLMIVHLGAVAWAVYVELSSGIICPLTDLENQFAQGAGLSTYKEDFVTRYLVPVIYPENLTFTVQYVLAAVVVVINLIAYRVLWKTKTGNWFRKI